MSILSDAKRARLVMVGTTLLVLLGLLGACASTPTSQQSATQGPPKSHLPPVGSGGPGGGDVTPTPAKLSVSPTTVGSWTACATASSSCPFAGKVLASVTLHNGASDANLLWSIGQTNFAAGTNTIQFSPTSGTLSPGQSATLWLLAGPSILEMALEGNALHLWFDVVGPVNTARVTERTRRKPRGFNPSGQAGFSSWV